MDVLHFFTLQVKVADGSRSEFPFASISWVVRTFVPCKLRRLPILQLPPLSASSVTEAKNSSGFLPCSLAVPWGGAVPPVSHNTG